MIAFVRREFPGITRQQVIKYLVVGPVIGIISLWALTSMVFCL